MSVLGAVLAGGTSSRMGTDKALVQMEGMTFLERVTESLAPITKDVVVLGEPRTGFETWPDTFDANGPLAGITTALSRADHDRVLVVAVDNALVRSETLRRLVSIESDLPVIPVDEDGVRQVTCGVYPTSLSPVAEEEAAIGGSVQSLLDRTSFHPVTPDIWRDWGEDGRSWFSFDSPESLVEARRRFP